MKSKWEPHLIVLLEGSVLEYWRLPRGFGLTAGGGGAGSGRGRRMGPGTVPPEALERLRELVARRAAAPPFAAPDASPPLAAGDDAVVERDGGPRG